MDKRNGHRFARIYKASHKSVKNASEVAANVISGILTVSIITLNVGDRSDEFGMNNTSPFMCPQLFMSAACLLSLRYINRWFKGYQ